MENGAVARSFFSTGRCHIGIRTAVVLSKMNIHKMLEELRLERQQIDEAVLILERLARWQPRRRGRPPAWLSVIKGPGRPPGRKSKSADE
jgi:hypothetical protein